MLPELQPLAQIFTERLLNTAVAGIVLAGLVWLLLRVMGRQNSGTRFAIWFSALLAMVALPFFSEASFVASHLPVLAPANPNGRIILPASFALWLFIAWAAGAGLLLLRLSVGLWRVRRFRKNCSDVDISTLGPASAGMLRDFASTHRVRICGSSSVAVPAVIGFFRPAIVFPAGLLPHLSSSEIEIILLHELAHLRRWDGWTNLTQKIVKALFFFHPAVWWIESRLTLEREMACDDIVLAQTYSPRSYASSLISFAEKLQGVRGLALAQALVSHMHQMSQRVAKILDAKRPGRPPLRGPVVALSAGVVALVLGAAPYMPRVVAFETHSRQNPAQQIQTQAAITKTAIAKTMPKIAEPQTDATLVHSVAARTAPRPRIAPQARAISAAFYPRRAAVPLLKIKKASLPRQPEVINASASPEELPVPETIFILRTTQYDASGTGFWTLCIWRVGGNNPAGSQLPSAIYVGLI